MRLVTQFAYFDLSHSEECNYLPIVVEHEGVHSWFCTKCGRAGKVEL